MFLSWFWVCAVICSVIFSVLTGRVGAAAAVTEGAVNAVELCIDMAGPLALWAGLGKLMDRVGLTGILSKVLSPVLRWLFPQIRTDPELAGHLSGNVTANLLGLGNAATPMGIRAAGRLRDPADPARATDQLCRLVVMNTASIQLLPTTVAAGLLAAKLQGRVWHD